MNLPDDCYLTYVIAHEAWYAKVPGTVDVPQLSIVASSRGGGCAWEFVAKEIELGQRTPSIRLDIFDDAFAAFEQLPGFFKTIGEVKPTTLAELVDILNGLGAVDDTERVEPERIRATTR
ncbi:hypothetical protein ACIBCT_20905 [Streptosporangium sp. NPDC050855]|uniref:hypothetical protein n=1 Tax=Streptosporangium sp. NPDC050855 TaxID=3366194 RepID=UPI0037BDB7DD